MRRTNRRAVLFTTFVAVCGCFAACGGEIDSGSDGTGGQPSTTDTVTASAGAGGAAATSGDSSNRVQLGDCTSGKVGSPSDPVSCPWYSTRNGQTICYPTKLEACSCICPSGAISNCISDWPSDSSGVSVYCS
jgi:hypothetical protein